MARRKRNIQLLLCFHTLRQRSDTHAVSKLHQTGKQCPSALLLRIEEDAAVDFYIVEPVGTQIRKRGVTGTHIVQRDMKAQRDQTVERFRCCAPVMHKAILRDLDNKAVM